MFHTSLRKIKGSLGSCLRGMVGEVEAVRVLYSTPFLPDLQP